MFTPPAPLPITPPPTSPEPAANTAPVRPALPPERQQELVKVLAGLLLKALPKEASHEPAG